MERDSIVGFITEDEFFRKLSSGCGDDFSEDNVTFPNPDEIILKNALVALYRLEYTPALKEAYQQMYIIYLRKYAELILPLLIRYGDMWMIYRLANIGSLPKRKINEYIDLAMDLSQVDMIAFLMDYKNRTWGIEPQFSLDAAEKPSDDWETLENPDGTLTIKKYLGKNEVVTIPSMLEDRHVSRIEGDLWSLKLSIFFPERDRVKSVIVEDGIEEIGEWAFLECSKLGTIQIPASVTKINHEAFAGCQSLKSIALPEGVNKIERGAFSGCNSLTSIVIPECVEEVGYRVFQDCSGLMSIVIPEGVQKINHRAFSGCSNLTSIVIPDSLKEIGEDAFRDCTSLTSIDIPDCVKEIGSGAFSGCSSLTSIVIPESVQLIREGSFKNCSSLSSVQIAKSVKEIGKSAFENCENLALLNIPEGVELIATFAFRGCTRLKSVMIPESVRELDGAAFACCENLVLHTSTGLHYFDDWGYFENPDDGTLIIREYFCTKTNVTIPAFIRGKKVSELGYRVFYGMQPQNSVVSVVIEEGIELIYQPFEGCNQLETVFIPESVYHIDESAFVYCKNVVIHAPQGSYAIEYAIENSIDFVET